jgi:hypothetical protein
VNHLLLVVLAALAAVAVAGLVWWIAHSGGRSVWPGWLLACVVTALLFTLAGTGTGGGS